MKSSAQWNNRNTILRTEITFHFYKDTHRPRNGKCSAITVLYAHSHVIRNLAFLAKFIISVSSNHSKEGKVSIPKELWSRLDENMGKTGLASTNQTAYCTPFPCKIFLDITPIWSLFPQMFSANLKFHCSISLFKG